MADKPDRGKGVKDADKSKAIDRLMKQTIASAGALAPDEIPHKVKNRLRDLATGKTHVDDYVEDEKKSRKKSAKKR